MAGTTTNGLPYPTGGDRVSDGDNAIKALAEAVDTGQRWGDTGTLTTAAAGFVVSAGFTNLSGSVKRRNGFVGVDINLNSTNALPAGDVLTQIQICTVPSGWQPPIRQSLVSGSFGPLLGYICQSGGIWISSVATPVAAGNGISVCGLWML